MLLLKLFFAFIQVGLFSVGGGYAAIPLIQEQIVNIYGMMTLEEFSDLFHRMYYPVLLHLSDVGSFLL